MFNLPKQIARSAPSISSLCFAEDTLIFSRATPEEALYLKGILDSYAVVSGQVINYEKSSMTFSRGLKVRRMEQIQHILGVQIVDKHDKYLGMPATVGRSKKEIFGLLRERIWKRINGWGEKFLSTVGREVMIKIVLQAIPSYLLMGCFLLPKNVTDIIERGFWWSGTWSKKMAWLAWSKLCESKEK